MIRSVLIICSMVGTIWAQNSINDYFNDQILGRVIPHVVDPAGIGMGRAGIAGPIGGNSLFSNPALVSLMDSAQVSLGGRGHYGYINDEYRDAYADELGIRGMDYGFSESGKFTHVSGTVPFIINTSAMPLTIAAGLGYHNGYDFSFIEFNDYKDSLTSTNSLIKYRGGLNFLDIGFSVGLADYGAVGISFNPSIGSGIRVMEETTITSNTIDDETEIESNYKLGLRAFFVNFGFVGRPFRNTSVGTMTLGMTVRPGFTLKSDEVEGEEETASTSSGAVTSIDTSFDLEAKLKVPASFGFGVHWQFLPFLAWAAEIQTRSFENMEIEHEIGNTDIEIETGLENGIAFHTGFEIKAGPVPIRTGFFFEHVPIGENDDTRIYNDIYYDGPVAILGGNLGVGIPIKIGRVDIGLTYARLKKEDRRHLPAGTGFKKYEYKEHNFFGCGGLVFNIPAPRFTAGGATASAAKTSPPAGTPAPAAVP